MASKPKPQLYAGQKAPNKDFYNRTFKAGQMSSKDLIRGLCINNPIARQIDDFMDELLRSYSAELVPVPGKEEMRVVQYWELDFGKDTQMIFDEPILRPLLQEFDCFQTKWILHNNIPYTWHCSAIRIWVRNNRMDMKKDERLQSEGSGYKRRYPEFSADADLSPTKRQKKPAPPVRLVDCVIVGVPKKYQTRSRTVVGEDGKEKEVAACAAVADMDRSDVAVKVTEVLKKGPSMQRIAEGVEDPRYQNDGDLKVSALSFASIKQEVKWEVVDEAAFWAWANIEEGQLVEIKNEAQLHRAVEALHQRDVASGRVELWHVVGR